MDNNIILIRIPYSHLAQLTLEDLDINKSNFIVKRKEKYD